MNKTFLLFASLLALSIFSVSCQKCTVCEYTLPGSQDTPSPIIFKEEFCSTKSKNLTTFESSWEQQALEADTTVMCTRR